MATKEVALILLYGFLRKNNILNINKINPQTLTILTILIAESNPKDKEKMIGLILQILK